jgi:hypothetical protein
MPLLHDPVVRQGQRLVRRCGASTGLRYASDLAGQAYCTLIPPRSTRQEISVSITSA